MARKKSKIIEIVKLTLRYLEEKSTNPSFETIITNTSFNGKIFYFEGKEYSFKIVSNNEIYTIGLIITRQLNGLPPKANRKLEFTELPLGKDEGLGYANIFLLYKSKDILFYEVNKNGCYLDNFRKMIHGFSNEEKIEPFDLKFATIFEKNQYNKIIGMNQYKQLLIDIADPSALVADFINSKDALEVAISESGRMKADSFRIDLRFDARSHLGIPSTYLKTILSKFQSLIKIPEKRQHITTFQVKGYSEDSETPKKLLPIDLMGDVFRKEIKITELRLLADLQENERKSEIIDLFNTCKDEIDTTFA